LNVQLNVFCPVTGEYTPCLAASGW